MSFNSSKNNSNLSQKSDLIQKITKQIIEKYEPEKIILFGSFAYGKPKENSDIDLW